MYDDEGYAIFARCSETGWRGADVWVGFVEGVGDGGWFGAYQYGMKKTCKCGKEETLLKNAQQSLLIHWL